MALLVGTTSTNPGPAITTTSNAAVTPQSNSDGYGVGQSVSDKIAFYGGVPIAQQASTVGAIQQLINLNLLPVGSNSNAAALLSGTGLTLTASQGQGMQTIDMNSLTGSTNVLPAATGSGARFKFVLGVIATSNSNIIKVANASDFMIGNVTTIDTATVTGYVAANSGTVATNSDTITLNRTTTGGVSVGDWIELEDLAANTWAVRGSTTSSGTAATPFSAAV